MEKGENCVITGISGRFPNANNIDEFWSLLLNGETGTSESWPQRWPIGLYSLPPKIGIIKNIDKFDDAFFDLSDEVAVLDPCFRINYEVVYEAIWDAGINPNELRHKKVSLIRGMFADDSLDELAKQNHGLLTKPIGAIASDFGFMGPSFDVDNACASSLSALNDAVTLVENKIVQSAVVLGNTLNLNPAKSSWYRVLQMNSPDGKSKCLDVAADGYCRSEAIAAIFVQQRKDAKRVYASILSIAESTDGFNEEGITFPKSATQATVMKEAIRKADVDPLQIEYVEAHVTGTAAGDPVECRSIFHAFRENSQKAIKIGCLKSNIGHTEGAAGLCAIAKIAFIFQNGVIPANLNFRNANQNIEGLISGQLIPVTSRTEFNGDIIPVNSFGFGGSNVTCILKANEKRSINDVCKIVAKYPRLINISGRTLDQINETINWINANRSRVTIDFLSLLNDVSKISFESKMNYRGYMIIEENNNVITRCSPLKTKKQPLCYIFSGFGANWPAVISGLMHFDPFAASIYKTAKIVQQFGINLIDIVMNQNSLTRHKITENIVAAMSTQLALFDALSFFRLTPDKVIGISFGEIVCSVVNGSVTREEMFVCLVNALQNVEKQESLENGSMITVEGEYDTIMKHCPPGVHRATNFTLGRVHLFVGSTNQITEFSQRLEEVTTPYKVETTCNNVLYCPEMLTNINLSSSSCSVVKEHEPAIHKIRYSMGSSDDSATSFGIPFIVRTLFPKMNLKRVIAEIPAKACVFEINCQPVVTRILKNISSDKYDHVSLISENSRNALLDLIIAIGEVYIHGYNPEIEKLYPKVKYPVSRETASLSPFLKWDHSKHHFVPKFPSCFKASDYSEAEIDLKDEEFSFITDHVIDGRIFFPASAFLYVAWKHFSLKQQLSNGKLWPNITFRNVEIIHAIICERQDMIKLEARYNKLSGDIYICNKGTICFTANVSIMNEDIHVSKKICDPSSLKLDQNSIYKELRVRGYDYGLTFQGITELNANGSHCRVKHSPHIISLLDSMLQLMIFNQKTRDLYVPVKLGDISLNLDIIYKVLTTNEVMDIFYDNETETLFAEGLVARNMKLSKLTRTEDANSRLHTYSFTPFDEHFYFKEETINALKKYNECCVSLIRSLKEEKYNGPPDFNETKLINFDKRRFPFIGSITKAIDEKKSTTEFIDSLTAKELNSFPISLKRRDLIDDQIQICLQNECSKKICVFEINDTCNSCKTIVEESCQLFDFSCDYNTFLADDFEKLATKSSKKVDIVIIVDPSWQLVIDKRGIGSIESTHQLMEKVYELLVNGGFLLVCCRTKITEFEREILNSDKLDDEQLSTKFEEVSNHSLFTRIGTKSDDLHFSTVLLRKVKRNEKMVSLATDIELNWLKKLQEELRNNTSVQIWLKSRSDELNGIAGFMKCILQEYGARRICCIVQDSDHVDDDIFKKQLTLNIKKGETFGTLVCKQFKEVLVSTKHAFVDTAIRGDLQSLRWFESPDKLWAELSKSERDEKFLINVHYGALNFRDVMLATNRIPNNAFPNENVGIGIEFSGITELGDRVFGVCDHKAIATTICAHKDNFFFNIPTQWSLQEAATVGTVYGTVYYSLLMRAKLRRNESILIHAGSGGVGQAAIRLCLSMNCDVFTSVGNEEKKRKLMELFPELNDRNFVDSRSLRFEENILKETNGRGVDIVLNSLSEEKLRASINCIAEGGRFIEIGKYDIINDTKIECLRKNYSFEIVCLSHLLFDAFHNKSKSAIKQIKQLKKLMNDGIESGCILPLPAVVFEKDRIEDAFRFMASGKHFGKVTIKIRDETQLVNECRVLASHRASFCPTKLYLIIGGLGGMGLQLAHWLSERGARKLVLTSRRGITDHYQQYMIDLIEKHGTEVTVTVNDFSDYSSVDRLIKAFSSKSPVGGIFSVALVSKDAIFEDMSIETFQEVCKPKITATKIVDKLSRKLSPQLDYFVCFSSVIASMGRVGQTNYAFANSALEMICKKRQKDGLPALAIQWGFVGDVGNVMESVKDNSFIGLGMKAQRIFSCLNALDLFLASNHTVCVSKVVADVNTGVVDNNDIVDHILHIAGARHVVVNANTTISDLGVDSLMVVEIGQMLKKNFNIGLNAKHIRALTLNDVRQYALC